MKITEPRTKGILNWLDGMTADHTLLFEEMTLFRDAASLIRQLQVEAKDAEIEALRAEVERLKTMTAVTMGVGSGDGKLFVHGDYESIKAAQALMFRDERVVQVRR